jgi:Non-classical export protein 1
MAPPTYLISKVADPFFALFIGLSAAAIRINREEKELGHSTQQTIDAGFRYVNIAPSVGSISTDDK